MLTLRCHRGLITECLHHAAGDSIPDIALIDQPNDPFILWLNKGPQARGDSRDQGFSTSEKLPYRPWKCL